MKDIPLESEISMVHLLVHQLDWIQVYPLDSMMMLALMRGCQSDCH